MRYHKWKPEHERFLLEHKDVFGAQKIADMLNAEFGTAYTADAVSYKRSVLRAFSYDRYYKNGHKGKWKHPLYSETVKKGYVYIKVADFPPVWWPKTRWVWVETHPGEPFSEKDVFIFLDGDNRNFAPDNILKVPLKCMAQLATHGGQKKRNPELTRLLAASINLKIASLDAGERLGIVDGSKRSGRRFKSKKQIDKK